jgi:hypothetical protein
MSSSISWAATLVIESARSNSRAPRTAAMPSKAQLVGRFRKFCVALRPSGGISGQRPAPSVVAVGALYVADGREAQGGEPMTRKREVTRVDLKRKWPHHVALPAETGPHQQRSRAASNALALVGARRRSKSPRTPLTKVAM